MTRSQLVLEVNETFDKHTGDFGRILITPAIGEDYWVYRVRLHADQALLGFPKFSTIGIGFALEEDWNTNLPFVVKAERIYKHIEHNKRYDEINRETCIEAIELIRQAAAAYKDVDLAAEEKRMEPSMERIDAIKKQLHDA